MTLQQLKYVLVVAEKGSMNEAAKALFIAQPSLTNAIKALETEMQITIFKRTNQGVILSNEGDEFLGYARQVVEQAELLEGRYNQQKKSHYRFSVSTQHYAFAVNAFVDVIRAFNADQYDFILRETTTYEIIEDVSMMRSEIGVLYLSEMNQGVLEKLLKQHKLTFQLLFEAKPHVFISCHHPLSEKSMITLEDLASYPYLSFEQGAHNAFYYAEEVLSTLERDQNIKVRDRATLFNLLVGLNGYTISTGVIDADLNGPLIIAKPLDVDTLIRVGTIHHKDVVLSRFGEAYLEGLKRHSLKL